MARKDLAGQINMFDVFRELENNMDGAGEVEMVALMPDDRFNEHDETGNDISADVMHRVKRDADGSILAEISYINYNKVLIRRKGHEDILKSFDNSYDAVDFYVANMKLEDF